MVHEDRGVEVVAVPGEELVAAIRPGIDLVAVSAVQSSTGVVLDLPAVIAASKEIGALLVIDGSQAVGWLPLTVDGIDALVVHTYKWLMSPRGATLGYLSPRLQELCRPSAANWYAARDVHGSYYGSRMDLAEGARRFDQSPSWFCYVGAAPALELIEQIGVETINRHNVELANEFREGLGLPPSNSAIVSTSLAGAQEAFASAGIRAAVRDGKLRASFHVYTTPADVHQALSALKPLH
jgi:selenocysteine lyase/cysteine desulfurase